MHILCVRSSFFPFAFLVLVLAAGCRNCQVVETALRMREQDLRAMREELLQKDFQLEALQRELYTLRQNAPPSTFRFPTEIAAQSYTLKRVTLGRSTGGFDDDGQPGDEALQVVIEPRDQNDDIIKAPGTAHITALEITPQGLKEPIGSWTLTASELRSKWKQGIFTTGYVFTLPWQKQPKYEKVRIILRFQVIDGRLFEADRDVQLRLVPYMPPATNGATQPSQPIPLPPPQPVKPGDLQPGKKKEPLPFPPPKEGPVLEPRTSQWHAPSLEGAFHLRRPVPLEPITPPPPPRY